MKRDDIKAVEMTRRIRDAHYEKLKEKSWDEQVAFYKERARHLHEELKHVETEKRNKTPA
jgi:hypothetical protein